MKAIKEIVVVEGKTDTAKLKTIYENIETFETKGNKISKRMLNTLKMINDQRGIICFLDPDGAGKAIRQTIIDFLPSAKHAFINKKAINQKSKKIGIAEANNQAIIDALNETITFSENNHSLTWQEYLSFNLNNSVKRKAISNALKICNYNHKQLFKILNYMNINYEMLAKIIEENKV